MLQIPRNQAIRGRVCRNCSGPIPKPKGNNLRKKVFCQDNCRKEFHKNNGVSVHKLKEQVRAWVREELKTIAEETRALCLGAIPTTSAHPKVGNGHSSMSQRKEVRS